MFAAAVMVAVRRLRGGRRLCRVVKHTRCAACRGSEACMGAVRWPDGGTANQGMRVGALVGLGRAAMDPSPPGRPQISFWVGGGGRVGMWAVAGPSFSRLTHPLHQHGEGALAQLRALHGMPVPHSAAHLKHVPAYPAHWCGQEPAPASAGVRACRHSPRQIGIGSNDAGRPILLKASAL